MSDRVLLAHAFRVAIVTAAGTAIARGFGLDFGYWVPLTALAIMQPDSRSTVVRCVQRATGTVVGVGVVAVLAVLTSNEWVLVGLVAAASFGLFALRERSYHWLVMLLTPTALLMISTADFEGWDIALTRIENSAIGIGLALFAVLVLWRHQSFHGRSQEP